MIRKILIGILLCSLATVAFATPSTPSGFTVSNVNLVRTQLSLSWTASSGTASYAIRRCTDTTVGVPCNPVTTLDSGWPKYTGATTYVDSGLTPGSTYRYEVSACDASWSCSAYTAVKNGNPTWPIKVVSVPGRYLVESNGTPWLLVGDAPHSIVQNVAQTGSPSDLETFMANEQAKGINAIWVESLCNCYITDNTATCIGQGSQTWNGCRYDDSTFDGKIPFTSTPSSSTPAPNNFNAAHMNTAYWSRVDGVVANAASHGIVVMLDPSETGGHLDGGNGVNYFNGGGNNTTTMTTYGQDLGTRYKDYPNIIWLSGNDHQNWRTAAEDNMVKAIATGIKSTDANHIHTLELDYNQSDSREDVNWVGTLDLDLGYSYYASYDTIKIGYQRSPAMPVFFGEGSYQNNSGWGPWDGDYTLRRQAWWTMTSGAAGAAYGNEHLVLYFANWKTNDLESSSRLEIPFLASFFNARKWWLLQPDFAHTWVTAGYGTYNADNTSAIGVIPHSSATTNTSDYATAALASDSSFGAVYIPSQRAVTVNMASFSGPVNARWFDPTTGTYPTTTTATPNQTSGSAITGSPFTNSGTVNFTPPSTNSEGNTGQKDDWVLVFDINVATGLQVNCGNGAQTNPTNCAFTFGSPPSGRFPTFSWTGSSANWRLQADEVSDFHVTNGACPANAGFSQAWLWDTGAQTTPATSAGYPSTQLGTCYQTTPTIQPQDLSHTNQQLWFGPRTFYWRVSLDGGTTWSDVATFSYENYPNAPTGLSVAAGTGLNPDGSGGTKESYGDTSVHATYYVGGAGASDVPTCGATGSPCATIGYAIGLSAGRSPATAPGDVFLLRTGTYAETLNITGSMPVGTKAKPITIKNDVGATPTITGMVFLRKAYWTVDGITSADASSGAFQEDASNLIIKNCTITGNGFLNNSDNAVVHIGKGPADTISSNYFMFNVMTSGCGSPCYEVEHHGGADLVIRNNDMSGVTSHGIYKTGDQSGQGNIMVSDNYIHNLTGANGAAVGNYYGTGKIAFFRNFVRDIQGGASFKITRGSEAELRNNTINTATSNNTVCYDLQDNDGHIIIDSDVCYDNFTPFTTKGTNWLHQHPVAWNNSTWYPNVARGVGNDQVSNTDGPCNADGTPCITQTNVSHADPALDNTTGKPSASSANVINLGNAAFSVPSGTDPVRRVDRGRFEYLASQNITSNVTYNYDALWTGINTTPHVSWAFSDADNLYNSAGQVQAYFEAQIDTVNTFDSQGDWKPLCSSGRIASANEFWDVPASCGLVGGTKYYVRVRTWDGLDTNVNAVGMWSDYVNAFSVLAGPACGNGIVDAGESCDDGNTVTETACPYGTPSCTLCSSDCHTVLNLTGPYCGDSILNGPEFCDTGAGYTLPATCQSLGFTGGTLVCASNCLSYNTQGCFTGAAAKTLNSATLAGGGIK